MILLESTDSLDLARYRRIARGGERIEVAPPLLEAVERRRATMVRALEGGARAYGVTTGLGYMASQEIPPAEQPGLQRSILLGRSVAVGAPLSREVVRGAMLLRLAGFLHGDAGVSAELCRFLVDRLDDGWTPYVPDGPDGAAGEVIPLSHLFQTFLGEGFVLEDGHRVPAAEALRARGVEPYEPGLKEGLALVNGAVLAPAVAVELVDRARALLDQATLAAALAAAVMGASWRPYSTRIGRLKGDPGQLRVHERLVALGDGSWRDLPQAPVSLRVVPQVHGAVHDLLDDAERQLEREVAAVTDSPLYLEADGAEPEGFYPSGNFHAQAVALRLDTVAIGTAQVSNLLEKRLHRLLDARFSSLPQQLAVLPGRQTGASVLHKAVVGLCAENRLLAAPASITPADTSAGQEDFQAFVLLAASKLRGVLDNLELALAYELLALRQAAQLSRRTLPGGLTRAFGLVAEIVAPLEDDRPLAPEVESVRALVASGALLA
jgi:histidine ammonia-lyase